MRRALICYQFFSAMDGASKDLSGVLRQLKISGYHAVEFIEFYNSPNKAIVDFLRGTGLIAVPNHALCAETSIDIVASF